MRKCIFKYWNRCQCTNQKDADTEENFVKGGRICETRKSVACLNQEFKEEKEEAMKSREGEEEEEEKCLKHTV